MMHFLKKIFLGSNLLLLSYNGLACGPELYSEATRFSIFRKETIDDPTLDPFHYSNSRFSTFNQSAYQSDREINLKEWMQYSKHSFSKKSLNIMQYLVSSDSFLTAFNNDQLTIFDGNDFLEYLLEKKNKEEFEYFVYAKKVEDAQLTTDKWDVGWDHEKLKLKIQNFNELAEAALKKLKKRKLSNFLKERYAFQYVKCAYYAYLYNDRVGDITQIKQIYDKYLQKSNSIVAHWGLIYYADIQSDSFDRARMLLRVFDKSGDKRIRVVQLLDGKVLDELRKIETDPYYIQLLNVFESIANKGRDFDAIKKLYEEDKNSKYLPLLITREINKLEDWIWTNPMLKFAPNIHLNNYYSQLYGERNPYLNTSIGTMANYVEQNLVSDIQYLKQYLEYISKMDFGENTLRNNFIRLAHIHLLNMDGQYKKAEELLKSINPNLSDAQLIQYNYERIITTSQIYDLSTQKAKDILAMALQFQIDNQPKSDRLKNSHHIWSSDWIMDEKQFDENFDPSILVYLGRKYLSIGETAIGSMMLLKSNLAFNEYIYNYVQDAKDSFNYSGISVLEKYAKPSDIDSIIALKRKINKSRFEQLIVPKYWMADEMYLDLKGTLYLRNGEYTKANEIFKTISPDFWSQNYYFADYLPLKSITDLDYYLPKNFGNGKVYPYVSKQLITQEIVDLMENIQKASSNVEKSKLLMLLANATFNLSYYGSGWMTFAYGKSSRELEFNHFNSDYNWAYYSITPSEYNKLDNYYGVSNAIELYRKVIEFSNDKELTAAATLMLARCDEFNHRFLSSYLNNQIKNDGKVIKYQSPYFREAKQQFENTQIYQLSKTTCPDVL